MNRRLQPILQSVLDHFSRLEKGIGGVYVVEGKAGFGKSLFREILVRSAQKQFSSSVVVSVECQSPIGNTPLSQFQPFYPFSKITDGLLEKSSGEEKRNLIRNIGLTMLAATPVFGDVFYAFKEIRRDLKEYKKEKDAVIRIKGNVEEEYLGIIEHCAEKSPLLFVIDDAQWCDAQSVQLIRTILNRSNSFPVLIVLLYDSEEVHRHSAPLADFLNSTSRTEQNYRADFLPPMSKVDIELELKSTTIPVAMHADYSARIFEQTGGVPAFVSETLESLSGSEDVEFALGHPLTFEMSLSKKISQLSSVDRSILETCSVEGRQCSVFVVSQLLGKSVVDTVRALKSLQERTSMIKSRGPQNKYGVKTTLYEFSTDSLQSTILKRLEFEEKHELHLRILSILKKQFEETESEVVKSELAPYILAHASQIGESDTVKEMLLATAGLAVAMGADALVELSESKFLELGGTLEEISEHHQFLDPFTDSAKKEDSLKPFDELLEEIILAIELGNHAEVLEHQDSCQAYPRLQRILLRCLLAQSSMRANETDIATANISQASLEVRDEENELRTLIEITTAQLAGLHSDRESMHRHLSTVLKTALHCGEEYKIVALQNLAVLSKKLKKEERMEVYTVLKEMGYGELAKT